MSNSQDLPSELAKARQELQNAQTRIAELEAQLQLTEALERQFQYHASLQQNVSDAVIVTDAEFRIQSWNKAAERIYGWRAEDIVGKVTAEILGTEYRSDTDHAHAVQELREQGWWQGEVIQYHQDGSIRHILGSVTLVKDSRGLPIGVVAVNHDISERMAAQKQAEEVLRQALAKEKELGELKSRFVMMASHEFRTPLATILALTETLSAYHLQLPDDQIEAKLSEIKGQVNHLKDIMDDVLMLARMQARRFEFNPVKVDLDAMCRSVLAEFRSHEDTHLRLDYTCGEGAYEVVLDPKLMRQILINVVSNALKYSAESKIVTITLEYTSSDLILQVRDEGIGIPEADLPHLFEPFHRAANVGTISGTGLGLVITREAVELHGGVITVDSQLNKGTLFTIRIPIVTQA